MSSSTAHELKRSTWWTGLPTIWWKLNSSLRTSRPFLSSRQGMRRVLSTAPALQIDEVLEEAQAAALALLRMELDAEHVALLDRRCDRTTVVGGPGHHVGLFGHEL